MTMYDFSNMGSSSYQTSYSHIARSEFLVKFHFPLASNHLVFTMNDGTYVVRYPIFITSISYSLHTMSQPTPAGVARGSRRPLAGRGTELPQRFWSR